MGTRGGTTAEALLAIWPVTNGVGSVRGWVLGLARPGMARPGMARPGICAGERGVGGAAVRVSSGERGRRGLSGAGGEGGGRGPPDERGLEGGKGRVPQLLLPGLALQAGT